MEDERDIVDVLEESAHARSQMAGHLLRRSPQQLFEWRAAQEIKKLRLEVASLQTQLDDIWGGDEDGRED